MASDWLDNGRIQQRHPAGAVVAAVAQVSALQHSHLPHAWFNYHQPIDALDSYASTVCPAHGQLSKIAVGMSDSEEVAAVAGMPRTPHLRCWLYPVTANHTGRRVCFTNGRVARVDQRPRLNRADLASANARAKTSDELLGREDARAAQRCAAWRNCELAQGMPSGLDLAPCDGDTPLSSEHGP